MCFREALTVAVAAAICVLAPVVSLAQDWTQWGGQDGRNMVSSAKGLPETFVPQFPTNDAASQPASAPAGGNLKWVARLGTQTYGNPTVAGGRVFVGTNAEGKRDPRFDTQAGALLCFRESDGRFLWQQVTPTITQSKTFNGDLPGIGICSSPTVEGDRLYVVTNRCEVLCLGTAGMAGGNRGPFKDEAQYLAKPLKQEMTPGPTGPIKKITPGTPIQPGPTDGDIIWRFDMIDQVQSWPQDASDCSILIHGDTLYVGTSNGVDKSHKNIPSPNAPSLIVLNKNTGELVATDDAQIGPKIFHGQWSSPSLGEVGGKTLVFYGGGDGVCYAFDAQPTAGDAGKPGVLKKVWWCDANPPEYRQRDGKALRYLQKAGPSEIISTPVFYEGRVYVTVGQDPRHGRGNGSLTCIDASGSGDISTSGVMWRFNDIERSLSTVSIADGLLYVADFGGFVYCLDARTGKLVWKYDTGSRIWASTLVADGKVYIGNEKGILTVLAAGKELKVLSKVELRSPIYTTPIVANGVLYVTSQKWLYAVQKNP